MRSRRLAALLFVALTIVSFGIFVHGEVPDVPTGQWLPGPALAQPREGAVSVALDDGRVLVIGGRTADGPVDTVEVFDTDGTISVGSSLLSPRAGHTATALPNGRVLVVGGTTLVTTDSDTGRVTSEAVTGSAEILEVNWDVWSPAPSLAIARSGHTATAVADGRVLVAGGVGDDGTALDSFEVFNPDSGAFSLGLLTAARTEHAAAAAGPNRVLAIGGRNADGVLNTADLIDLESGTIASVVLNVPRAGASATTLLGGKILVAGGSDGSGELGSAEIVDPVTGLSAVTGSMSQARRGHQALLLDNNNTVMVVGGTNAGSLVASAEQFIPWSSTFSTTASPAKPRTPAIALNLSRSGTAWLAGGRGNDGDPIATSEFYGFATLKTDKDDYAPGTTVVVTGAGWQPGERVTLALHEVNTGHADRTYYADADGAGQIVNTAFVPDISHLGVRFYLTARGAASEAQVTFTDGRTVVSATLNGSTSVTVAPAATLSAVVSVTTDNGLGNQNWRSTGWRISTTAGSVTCVNHVDHDGIGSYSETFNVIAPGAAGTFNAYFVAYSDNACTSQASPTFSLVNGVVVSATRATSTALARTAGADPSAHGDSLTLTATVTATGGNPSGAGTVTFKDGTTAVCSNVPLSGNIASCSTSTLAIGSHSITAEYSGTTTGSPQFQASTSPVLAQTIDKANQTVTFDALGGKTYGDAPFEVAATTSSGLPVSFAASGTCTLSGSTVTITGAGSCTITASQAGDSNYNAAAPVPQSFNIDKAATVTTVTCTAGPFTFSGSPQEPCSAMVTGPAGLSETVAVNYTNNTNTGTATASANYAESANYLQSAGSTTFTIGRAPVTATAGGGSATYNGATHAPSACAVTGAYTGDLVCANDPVSVGPDVSTTSIAPVVTGSGLSNFEISTVNGSFTIEKAPVTATAGGGSGTYDGATHAPSACAVTGAYTGDLACTNDPGSVGPNVSTTTIGAVVNGTGLGNFEISTVNGLYEISKKAASVTPHAASKVFGAPDPVLTGTLVGFVPADGVTATYSRTPGETVAGSPYIISATLSPSAVLANYTISYNTANFAVTAWTLTGFYQPVTMGVGVYNTVKGGSTVPLKFNIYQGTTERTDVDAISGFAVTNGSCAAAPEDPVDFVTTGGTNLRYDATARQFIQNWQTPKPPGVCYRVTMTTQDGSSLVGYFKTK